MTNLTASEARRLIERLHHNQTKEHGISILEEKYKYLAALEIALTVLEQQDVMSVPAYYIVYYPNPNPDVNDDKEHSECGSIHLARKLAAKIGGTIRPVYIGEQQQPQTDTYRQIENDGWIEWCGGECPVDGVARVELRWSHGGPNVVGRASNFGWANRVSQGFNSIIAYRVIENDGREG